MVRIRPFRAIGHCPLNRNASISHNAGDFGSFLVDAPHHYSISHEELIEHMTDGHMDIDAVRPGAILVAPVKVKGAGVYVGDT